LPTSRPNIYERTAAGAREAGRLSSEADDDDLWLQSQLALSRHQARAESIAREQLLMKELKASELPRFNFALFMAPAMRTRWGDFAEAIALAERPVRSRRN
jgi:hypothetical protein